MSQTLTSPFALRRLRHRSNPLGLTLRRHSHYVTARRCAQMLTREISHSGLTGAVTEPLAVALTNVEVNGILVAVVAVRHTVLPKDGCGLDEEVARFGSLGGFG